jgi:hypothetical protein
MGTGKRRRSERKVFTVSHEEAHAPVGSAVFTPEERTALRQDDIQAARNIVCLMVGVFVLGLLLYLYIAIVI